MITDKEIQKIFDWADKNKVVGKSWKRAKWGINLVGDEINSVKKGIPRDKDTLLQITHLNLEKSRLSDIPVELFKLTKLKLLNISGNQLEALPKEIGNLEDLEYLDLNRNSIWSEKNGYSSLHIPNEIKKLKKLKYLDLSDIKLNDFPKEIWELQSLEVLNLGFYDSSISIPKEIGNLINLIDLKLRYLSNTELPYEIGNLKKLKSLKIVNCDKLKNIPKKIENLENLINLELEYLNITELPSEIGNLVNLVSLKIESCDKLKNIPKEIGKLQALEYLEITWNENLKELPKEIGSLSKLKELDLRGSEIEKLPSELSNLINLKRLNGEPTYIKIKNEDKSVQITNENILKKQFFSKEKFANLNFPHKNILLKGVPGTGKSKTIDNIIEKNLKMSIIPENVLRINIHSASSNSDLMQGISISTNDNNDILYAEKRGTVLKHIFKAMYKPKQPFVLVLEEIQENSLNELIGDLIYLIEKDKRTKIKLEDEQELSYDELFKKIKPRHFVELPNLVENSESNTKMIMPDNLYVFCTSNYRDDRKVIEDNLLRRFDVVEIYPQYQDKLGKEIFKSKDVSDFLEKLNESILKQFKDETHPDRYLVGHANWLAITEDKNDEDKKLFYTALLKVIIEFKEIREVDFNAYVKPILQKLFKKDDELSDRVEEYLEIFYDGSTLKLGSYKSLVEKLQIEIYSDFL